jgi:hypothetical protein
MTIVTLLNLKRLESAVCSAADIFVGNIHQSIKSNSEQLQKVYKIKMIPVFLENGLFKSHLSRSVLALLFKKIDLTPFHFLELKLGT